MINYKQILTDNGFVMYKHCRCSGAYEEFFRTNPPSKLEISIKPGRQIMKTMINRRVVCITGIENLQSEIDKYKP